MDEGKGEPFMTTDQREIRAQLEKLQRDTHRLVERLDNSEVVIERAPVEPEKRPRPRVARTLKGVNLTPTPISDEEYDQVAHRSAKEYGAMYELRKQLSVLLPGDKVRFGPYESDAIARRVQGMFTQAVEGLNWPRVPIPGSAKGGPPYASSIGDDFSIVFQRLA
jgi:septal ring factor EnvC (AmiA/AmiB activator)